jgi:methionine aminotransferase
MNSLIQIESKLPQVGTTIFTVMSALANQLGATNLSQGFPDFEVHPKMIDLITHYLKKGLNQYAPMPGVMALREAIAEKTEQLYGAKCHPDTEITVTSGASEALFDAIACIIRPGDEVMIFEPAYDLYIPAIELFGGKVVPVTMNDDYSIDWQKAQAALSPQTRMIIINTPHNPSGAILQKSDLQKLIQLIDNQDIIVVSDEVYEHIIFDEIRHESVLRYPELREKSFVISSFGKTYHATGWKIGYCIASEALTKEFRKIHQFNTFSTVSPIQYALADFLQEPSHYLDLPAFYQERRDKFRAMMAQTAFKLLPCAGTYFQLASYSHLSNEKDTDYCVRLTREVGVATIPISVFYSNPIIDNQVIRFCFAKRYETLEQGIEKLIKFEERLSSPHA